MRISTASEPIDIDYHPQPKQIILHRSPANEILFGGAAGPGKSRALRGEGLAWCLRIPNLQAYLFRRTFTELEDNHIINSLLEFPSNLGRYKENKRRWDFFNGAMLHFCHAQYEKDVFIYQGAEIHLLLIDELTTFTQFQYEYLYGRVRCPLIIPIKYRHKIPGAISASNPGGVGHEFVKARWVKFAKPFELKRSPKDPEHPEVKPSVRQYIPALLEDNPHLAETDPGYIVRLNNLPEPWRTAYKKGDWDIFMGQAFLFSERHHVIKPMPIPEGAPLYMTFDWGFGKPFSIGWWFVDADNRLIRFAELYGQMKGAENDTGVRWTDPVIADKIIELEKEQGISGKHIIRLCDPTCMNKKPDYKGGGQGPSTAEEFMKKGIELLPGDPSRLLKIRQVHERLRIPIEDDGTEGMPMLVVFDTCVDFIRTIPTLQADTNKPEDIDTTQEDHCYDEAALLCMARPLSLDPVAVAATFAALAKAAKRAKLKGATKAAWTELDEFERQQQKDVGEETIWEPL